MIKKITITTTPHSKTGYFKIFAHWSEKLGAKTTDGKNVMRAHSTRCHENLLDVLRGVYQQSEDLNPEDILKIKFENSSPDFSIIDYLNGKHQYQVP